MYLFKIENQFKSIFIFILIFTLLGFYIANYSVKNVTTSYESVLDHSLPIMNKTSQLAQLSSQLESKLIKLHFDTLNTIENERIKKERIEELSLYWVDIKELLDEFLMYDIIPDKEILENRYKIDEYLKYSPKMLDEINFLIQAKSEELVFIEDIETIINYNDKILLAEIESFWKEQLSLISVKDYDEEINYSSNFYKNSTQLLSYFRQVFLTNDISTLNRLKRNSVLLYRDMESSGSSEYEYKLFADEFLEKVKPVYSGKNSLFKARHDILRLTNIIDSLIKREIATTERIKEISVLIQSEIQKSLANQKTKITNELYRANQYSILMIVGIFSVVFFALWFLVNQNLIKRIANIRLKVLELSKGNTNIDLNVYKNDEIGDIEESLSDLKGYVEEAKKLSTTDPLTGLLNKAQFKKNLENEIRRCARLKQTVSLAILDIDYFKNYNDTYGHPQGDKCIKILSKLITKATQRAGDTSYRIGGEEFAIIMPNTSSNEIYKIMTKMQEELEKCNLEHKKSEVSNKVTISIGIYTSNDYAPNSSNIFYEKADVSLYKAKINRNSIVLCEDIS